MQLKDKNLNKEKNHTAKGRLIAQMIAAGMCISSFAVFGAGIYACNNAVQDNPTNYTEDSRYIAGMVSTCVATPLLTIGLGSYPYQTEKKENGNKQENLNNL